MSWKEIVQKDAAPQARNIVLIFFGLFVVFLTIIFQDYSNFQKTLRSYQEIQKEASILGVLRQELVRDTIIKANIKTKCAFWHNPNIGCTVDLEENSEITQEEQASVSPKSASRMGAVCRSDQDREHCNFADWARSLRANNENVEDEALETVFRVNALPGELRAYEQLTLLIEEKNKAVKDPLGTGEFDFADTTLRYPKPLGPFLWLSLLAVTLWPVSRFVSTLQLAQQSAGIESDGQNTSAGADNSSLWSVRFIQESDGSTSIEPSALFGFLCVLMAATAGWATLMSMDYTTAQFSKDESPTILRDFVQGTSLILLVAILAAFLSVGLRSLVGIPAVFPNGPLTVFMDRAPWRPTALLSRRDAMLGGWAIALSSALAAWRFGGFKEAISLRTRDASWKSYSNMIFAAGDEAVQRTAGFYWIEPGASGTGKSLVYLEDISDLPHQAANSLVLFGWSGEPGDREVTRVDSIDIELAIIDDSMGGNIRGYWIEHAVLDLLEQGKIPDALALLKRAIVFDIDVGLQTRTSHKRRLCVRLIDLFMRVAHRNVDQLKEVHLILKRKLSAPKGLSDTNIAALKSRLERIELINNDSAVEDKRLDRREPNFWKLPRRITQRGEFRAARTYRLS